MIIKYYIIFAHLPFFASAKIYKSISRADSLTSTETTLLDLQILNASILQCNIHCVKNCDCNAFTVRKTGSPNSSFRSEFNICKLQRVSNSSNIENNNSSSSNEEIIMFMNREPIYEMPSPEGTRLPFHPNLSLSTATTTSTTISTTKLTTVTSLTPTTTAPAAVSIPKYTDYLLTAIDELDDDKYMFFWSDFTNNEIKKPLKLTVMPKNNLSGSELQNFNFTDIFLGFSGTMITTVFTVNNITYICNSSNAYFKYQINKRSDGLILSADKLSGGITNLILTKSVYMTTSIGNSTVLMRQQDAKTFCFHIDVINSNQITNPAPSSECQKIADQLKTDTTTLLTSAVGHDASSLRFLYNSKLNSYDAN